MDALQEYAVFAGANGRITCFLDKDIMNLEATVKRRLKSTRET
jgi:hypothetical protein